MISFFRNWLIWENPIHDCLVQHGFMMHILFVNVELYCGGFFPILESIYILWIIAGYKCEKSSFNLSTYFICHVFEFLLILLYYSALCYDTPLKVIHWQHEHIDCNSEGILKECANHFQGPLCKVYWPKQHTAQSTETVQPYSLKDSAQLLPQAIHIVLIETLLLLGLLIEWIILILIFSASASRGVIYSCQCTLWSTSSDALQSPSA